MELISTFTRSELAYNGKVRLQPLHSTQVSPQQHDTDPRRSWRSAVRGFVCSRYERREWWAENVAVLWNAASQGPSWRDRVRVSARKGSLGGTKGPSTPRRHTGPIW